MFSHAITQPMRSYSLTPLIASMPAAPLGTGPWPQRTSSFANLANTSVASFNSVQTSMTTPQRAPLDVNKPLPSLPHKAPRKNTSASTLKLPPNISTERHLVFRPVARVLLKKSLNDFDRDAFGGFPVHFRPEVLKLASLSKVSYDVIQDILKEFYEDTMADFKSVRKGRRRHARESNALCYDFKDQRRCPTCCCLNQMGAAVEARLGAVNQAMLAMKKTKKLVQREH